MRLPDGIAGAGRCPGAGLSGGKAGDRMFLFRRTDINEAVNECTGTPGAVLLDVREPEEFRGLLWGYQGRIYTIDARSISERNLGNYFPNTPMLAAIVKVSKVLDEDQFAKDMEESFRHKFASKPQVIDGNMNCLKQSLKEVKGA